jgi:hypothetical protein
LGLRAPIGQICTVANDTAKFRPTDQIGGYARGFRWWRSLCGGYLFTGAGVSTLAKAILTVTSRW